MGKRDLFQGPRSFVTLAQTPLADCRSYKSSFYGVFMSSARKKVSVTSFQTRYGQRKAPQKISRVISGSAFEFAQSLAPPKRVMNGAS